MVNKQKFQLILRDLTTIGIKQVDKPKGRGPKFKDSKVLKSKPRIELCEDCGLLVEDRCVDYKKVSTEYGQAAWQKTCKKCHAEFEPIQITKKKP